MLLFSTRNRNDLLHFAFGRTKCHIIHLIRLGDHITAENHFKCKLYLEMSTANKQVNEERRRPTKLTLNTENQLSELFICYINIKEASRCGCELV